MAFSIQGASESFPSAKSTVLEWKYDVFLSFRGEDIRSNFLSHLYHELQNTRRIKTFKDDKELEVGDSIPPSLHKAIEESRFAIIVLSPNYAASPWCLEELTTIVHCMESNNRILPLFYHVKPSDVRHQKKSFEVAFSKHEQMSRHDIEKVKQWRDALKKVANFSGWHTQNYQTERELVEAIAEFVCTKVRPIEIEFSMSTGDFEEFEATRQAMDEVMTALNDDKVTAIAVYGMGGVGKTTLVEYVGEQAQNTGIVHHVIMAIISQKPNTRYIQGTLADLLGLELKEETDIGRAKRLKSEILKRNKILIILDDVWDRIDLSSIGIPSYVELHNRNSKVLLTTRRLNVCHSMEAQPSIHLNTLSDEDSWTLFVKKAKKPFENSIEFYDVAKKVARECAGLPVALRAVARALGDKDFEEWKEAARRLEMSQRASLDDEGDVFKCIKLSYDYLDSTDAKSCFLLCCLFPEDDDILIEDLMKYGFGKGLFRDVNSTIENARVIANSVTKYLRASCLLLEGREHGCVRMHDVIRDMAMSIALSEDGYGFLVKTRCELKEWPMDAHEGYSAISLMENNICKLPNELVCSKLQILLLQRNVGIRKIPKNFFQSPKELKVLDLSRTSITLRPPSFNLLTSLQALYLDYCESIIDMSMLKSLKKLEILSIRGCDIGKFPKEIGQLTNLRMLDLTNIGDIDRVPPHVISRLHRLEELYMKCKFGDWGSKVEGGFYSFVFGENAGFEELIGLSHLSILELSVFSPECLPKTVVCNPNWVSFDICINRNSYRGISSMRRDRPHHHSRTLSLDTTINTLPDWFINVVTKKAERLFYFGCKGLSSIVLEHDHGRLHGLNRLAVHADENLKVFLNTTKRVSNEPLFGNLEVLHLGDMCCLKELCVGELPPGSLSKLKVLDIRDCCDLIYELLPSKLLHTLQNVEEIICHDLRQLEYVFGFEGLELQQTILTKLRKMRLYSHPSLVRIWKGPAPHAVFHNLRSLAVEWCIKVKCLFTSNTAQCLLHLEDLWIQSCKSLERIIEASEETIVFPELKNFILKDLPQLTRFCCPNSVDIEFPSLEHLYVCDCPQLSPSASDFKSRNHVQLNNEQLMSSLYRRLWDLELRSGNKQ